MHNVAVLIVIPLLFFFLPAMPFVSADCTVLLSAHPLDSLFVPASSRPSVPPVSTASAFLAAAAFFLAFFLADLEGPAPTCASGLQYYHVLHGRVASTVQYNMHIWRTSDWLVISESGFVSTPIAAISSCISSVVAAVAVSFMFACHQRCTRRCPLTIYAGTLIITCTGHLSYERDLQVRLTLTGVPAG